MNSLPCAASGLAPRALAFLNGSGWGDAACEPLTGDASTRRYFRLRRRGQNAILMDASRNPDSVGPFLRIDRHLERLGFSVPAILAPEDGQGLLLLEDFGDETFTRLLESGSETEGLYALATDVLVGLHKHPQAIPEGLRAYHPQKMLEDIELFLDWCTPGVSEEGKVGFRRVWGEVLPQAHKVPSTLLLRDYHVANLMWLPERKGLRQAGLLDFQDAYQGPVTYDLVSLLEDARRDVPEALRRKMVARYLGRFPELDRDAFAISLSILAALRHTRVLAIFDRLSRHEGKPEYKKLHSPRVAHLLRRALLHPGLAEVKRWFETYAW
jgi:N-acetylmuramate 1-kinase